MDSQKSLNMNKAHDNIRGSSNNFVHDEWKKSARRGVFETISPNRINKDFQESE